MGISAAVEAPRYVCVQRWGTGNASDYCLERAGWGNASERAHLRQKVPVCLKFATTEAAAEFAECIINAGGAATCVSSCNGCT